MMEREVLSQDEVEELRAYHHKIRNTKPPQAMIDGLAEHGWKYWGFHTYGNSVLDHPELRYWMHLYLSPVTLEWGCRFEPQFFRPGRTNNRERYAEPPPTMSRPKSWAKAEQFAVDFKAQHQVYLEPLGIEISGMYVRFTTVSGNVRKIWF